jgi:predicted MFS family arabinose efflux permease
MSAVFTLNLVDRGLIALLLQPIKEDLGLSDTQLGFLTGIAFGLFYATMGVPIARWADHGNRVTIASLAIGLWGLTVMACLIVTSYAQLVVARIAAAIGESGCKPPTYSLIGDYFPEPAERTRAMGVYWLGNPLSALISFIVGGWLNDLFGWRKTFFLMGLAGLVLSATLWLTVTDPRARRTRLRKYAQPQSPTKLVLATLWHRRSLRHLSIALILLYTMGLGLAPWYAAFMMRSHGMSTAQLGVWLGLIFGVGGVVGTLVGGYVASRWLPNAERRQVHLCAVAVALLVPCYVAFLTLPGRHHALMALVPLTIVFSIFMAPIYALMQRLVADDMRATTMAVVMLFANLIGMGVGPQVVGILSDGLTPSLNQDALRYAMLAMSFTALWASYHFWTAGATVENDLFVNPRGVVAE